MPSISIVMVRSVENVPSPLSICGLSSIGASPITSSRLNSPFMGSFTPAMRSRFTIPGPLYSSSCLVCSCGGARYPAIEVEELALHVRADLIVGVAHKRDRVMEPRGRLYFDHVVERRLVEHATLILERAA